MVYRKRDWGGRETLVFFYFIFLMYYIGRLAGSYYTTGNLRFQNKMDTGWLWESPRQGE